jgi:Na+-driven multidrug efflux pump
MPNMRAVASPPAEVSMSEIGSPLPPDLEDSELAAILPETPRDDEPTEDEAEEPEQRGTDEEADENEEEEEEDTSYRALLLLSLPAIANEASRPLAALILVALVGNAGSADDGNGEMLAAFAAVTATVSFASALCNFLLTVTTSQLGKAIGQKSWAEVGPRVHTASAVALVVGLACALMLALLTGPLFDAMDLAPEVETIALPFMYWRLATVPLLFLITTASGVLSGYKRIFAMATVNCSVALAEVATAYLALYAFEGGLAELGLVGFITTAGGVVVAAVVAVKLPPDEAQGAIVLMPATTCFGGEGHSYADLNGAAPKQGTEVDQEEEEDDDEEREGEADVQQERKDTHVWEYLCASKDQTIRSLALHASVYAMAVGAGQLGTAPLAAHQIVMSLWMLSAYVCDGFAVIANSLGSARYARGDDIGDLSKKLLLMGAGCGGLCGLVLFVFSGSVMDCFTSHSNVVEQLKTVWWMLCLMQPTNGAVFVLDGLLAALQAWEFAAQAMVGSVALLFFPTLLIGNLLVPEDADGATLVLIWAAKCVLNLGRFMTAGLYVLHKYDPQPSHTQLQTAEASMEEVARGGVSASASGGDEEDPLVPDAPQQQAAAAAAAAAAANIEGGQGALSPSSAELRRMHEQEAQRNKEAQRALEAERAEIDELEREHATINSHISQLSPQPQTRDAAPLKGSV